MFRLIFKFSIVKDIRDCIRSYEGPMRPKGHDPILDHLLYTSSCTRGCHPSSFSTKDKSIFIFWMLSTYITHSFFLKMVCLMILCKEYKFWIFTIGNFLQFPLLCLNIPVTAMLPHTPHSLLQKVKLRTNAKQQTLCSFVCCNLHVLSSRRSSLNDLMKLRIS